MGDRRILALPLVLLLFAGTACISRNTVPRTGYLDHQSQMKDVDFKQQYVATSPSLTGFRSVQIKKLRMGDFKGKDKGKPVSSKDQAALQAKFRQAFEKELGKTHRIVSPNQTAGSGTLVIEPSLVSVNTPNIPLNVLTTLLIAPISDGGAAFQAKLIDGGTGQTVAELAEDHEGGLSFGTVICCTSYTTYGYAEYAFRDWASRLSKLLQGQGKAGTS